jgi:hypothetical protein
MYLGSFLWPKDQFLPTNLIILDPLKAIDNTSKATRENFYRVGL